MIVQHHQHGHEHRPQNGPLGGGGGHEEVGQGHDQHEQGDQRQAGQPHTLDEVGAGDGDDGADVGPAEQGVELAAEEAEHQIAAHQGHLLADGVFNVGHPAELPHRDAVGDAHHKKGGEHDGDDAVQQGGADKAQAAVLVDLGQGHQEVPGHHQGDVHHQRDAGVAHALPFQGGELLLLNDRQSGGAHIGAELLGHDLVGYQGDGQSHQEGGGEGEVVVAAHVNGEVAAGQEDLDGGVGEPRGDGVRGGEHQVAGKARLTAGVGHQHAHHRVLAYAVVHGGGQGHQHDVAAVRGDVAVAAHEGHHQGHDDGGGVPKGAADGGAEQPRLVAQAHRHGQDQHHAQGVEGGEVLHHAQQQPVDAVGGEEVLYRHQLVGGGVHQGHAQAGQNGAGDGGDHKQDEKDDAGGRKPVADPFDRPQNAWSSWSGCGVAHKISPF